VAHRQSLEIEIDQHVAREHDTGLAAAQEIRGTTDASARSERSWLLGPADLQRVWMIGLYGLAQALCPMMQVDHDFRDTVSGEEREQQADQRAASHGKSGLGAQRAQRMHPRAVARRQDHGPHAAPPGPARCASGRVRVRFIPPAPRSDYRMLEPPG